MAFEKFEKETASGRKSKIPQVAIWQQGLIGFNVKAIEAYNLGEYNFMEIYFDKDAQRIGFKFIKEDKKYARRLVHNRTRCIASCCVFLKYYNIDYSESKRYSLVFDQESGLYVIDLNNP